VTTRLWATAGVLAVALLISAASYAQQDRLTWAEAVDYVAQHGSGSSFYGPVAMSLGLGNGTTDYRVLSTPGAPKRDFYVTDNAVVLSVTWPSGASRGYTASKGGVLRQVLDRNRTIPIPQAVGAFEAEKQWWIAVISTDKPKAGY
jgi:hypothetical protein